MLLTRSAALLSLLSASLVLALPLSDDQIPESDNQPNSKEGIVCPRLVSRHEWGALPPRETHNVSLPVEYVVIHHTYIPPACWTSHDCRNAMVAMQKMHQEERGWFDIGYNFVIGGDGRGYIGRGWGKEGAHAPPYNQKSVGISLIGDWRETLPSEKMLSTTKLLIQCGVKLGFISPDYKLLGHMQARTVTECPGTALFNEIRTWPHWSAQWIHQPPTAAPNASPAPAPTAKPKGAYYFLAEAPAKVSTNDATESNDDSPPQVVRTRRRRRSPNGRQDRHTAS